MTETEKEVLGKLQEAIALTGRYAEENRQLEKHLADTLEHAKRLMALLENERKLTEQLGSLNVQLEVAYIALKAILSRGINSEN